MNVLGGRDREQAIEAAMRTEDAGVLLIHRDAMGRIVDAIEALPPQTNDSDEYDQTN